MARFRTDSLNTRRTLTVGDRSVVYYSLAAASDAAGIGDISRLPYSLKVLLENLMRFEDGRSVTVDDIKAMGTWLQDRTSSREIAYRPARVLMQDFTGVPGVVDLAAMREAMVRLGGDPQKINPLTPVDLVIDHSVMVDHFGSSDALERNIEMEFKRNAERYKFLRWGQSAFDNFRVVPPGVGICHQVNLEYLARVVWTAEDDDGVVVAYPDTLVGTDSHTTMVNGLGVLGWGVGGIEAEAAMLGQPISMLIPEVVGMRLTNRLGDGATATDLVLTVTEMLRRHGVVGKFVEFFGPGLSNLTLPDRATISNMAPEYGATCGIFPVDDETLEYLRFTGREADLIALVEAYAKEQGLWRTDSEPAFTATLDLDLATVEPSLAGPKRPQDRVTLAQVPASYRTALADLGDADAGQRSVPVAGAGYEVADGAVVIAAITSCTNTSNPSVLMAAGLLAEKAVQKGLSSKPWVKTSLAPGSQVVEDYLKQAGLQNSLDKLGFQIAGFGCTTCIGNSGSLPEAIANAVDEKDLVVGAVLSGNRNFEGRVHPQVKANYLASPPLVVAYALAGRLDVDLATEPLGADGDGNPVYLKDIWPSPHEIQNAIKRHITPEMYNRRYANVFTGPTQWQELSATGGQTYDWQGQSTYVKNPPYFDDMGLEPTPATDIVGARMLALLGDSVTTDHISPAGSIKVESPAGAYLTERQVRPVDFNSYGSRRGNHEIMMRGTFANIRIRNYMLGEKPPQGGLTRHQPSGDQMSIYDAAMRYQAEGVPLVVIGGKEYGTGSSRDWAAKGTRLLGVRAVIAESFERIHRSNLVGMGVLPLQFHDGDGQASLGLDGTETFTIRGVADVQPRQDLDVEIARADGRSRAVRVTCRIDTEDELEYFRNGGILPYVLRSLAKAA